MHCSCDDIVGLGNNGLILIEIALSRSTHIRVLGVLFGAQARIDVRAESLHVSFQQHFQVISKKHWISPNSHVWQVDALVMTLSKAPLF